MKNGETRKKTNPQKMKIQKKYIYFLALWIDGKKKVHNM